MILLSAGQLGFNINALLAVTMSAILLSALLGPQMFEMYEGRSRVLNWSGARMILVRWSIILNLSSAFSLYLFSTAYEPAVTWHIIIPGTFLVVLVGGTWLLGLQKTSGLLLVASGCLGLIPAGTFFVLREAASPAEAVLFGLLLAPGVVLGCSLVVVFGRSVLDKLVPR